MAYLTRCPFCMRLKRFDPAPFGEIHGSPRTNCPQCGERYDVEPFRSRVSERIRTPRT